MAVSGILLHSLYTPSTPSTPPHQVSGTLQSGTLRPGQKLLLLPGAEAVHVKAVHSRGVAVTLATAGDHVEVGLPTYLPSNVVTHSPTHPLAHSPTHPLTQVGLVGCAADSSIAQGSVLCDPQRPAHLARQVEVRLRVFGVQVRTSRGLESRQCGPLRRGHGWALPGALTHDTPPHPSVPRP